MYSLHHDTVQQSASTPPNEKAGSCPQFPASLAAGGSHRLVRPPPVASLSPGAST